MAAWRAEHGEPPEGFGWSGSWSPGADGTRVFDGAQLVPLADLERAKPRRRCYWVPYDAFVPERGYVPSVVVEDEAGHSPLVGTGECSESWFWGMTHEQAKKVCDDANRRTFGLDPEEANEIVSSSLAAQFRLEAARREVDRKMGRDVA